MFLHLLDPNGSPIGIVHGCLALAPSPACQSADEPAVGPRLLLYVPHRTGQLVLIVEWVGTPSVQKLEINLLSIRFFPFAYFSLWTSLRDASVCR